MTCNARCGAGRPPLYHGAAGGAAPGQRDEPAAAAGAGAAADGRAPAGRRRARARAPRALQARARLRAHHRHATQNYPRVQVHGNV